MIVTMMTMTKRARVTSDAAAKNETERVPRAAEYEAGRACRKKVGVRRETIIRLEKGQYNPSLKLAMDIAKVFGAAVEDIFSFEPDPAEDYQVFENKYEN